MSRNRLRPNEKHCRFVWSALLGASISIILILFPHKIHAQEYSIDVVFDSNFADTAEEFLSRLLARLDPEVKKVIKFKTYNATTDQLIKSIDRLTWGIAIVSTSVLAEASQGTVAKAFELPFVFADATSILSFQRSPYGQSGLAHNPDNGITGLVYLNSGAMRLAGEIAPYSPDDLKGSKIATRTDGIAASLIQLGASTVELTKYDQMMALQSGSVDSVVVESGQPASWVLPQGGYVLENSIRGNVGMVLVRDEVWRGLPFLFRTMISDAAVEAAREIDNKVVEADAAFRAQVGLLKMQSVRFQEADVTEAVKTWIAAQPVEDQPHYDKALRIITAPPVRQAPPTTLPPRNRTDAGTVYFATTREDSGHRKPMYRFGDGRTDVIKCGKAMFPRSASSARMASFAGPVIVGNDNCSAFVKDAFSTGRQSLIFVHGYSNRFYDALKRAMLLSSTLGDETVVLLWSWPSYRDADGTDYDYDKESVTGISRSLLQRLLTAVGSSENLPIDILAHSMGGWHIVGVMTGLSDASAGVQIRNLVMAAPDVPTDEFRFGLNAMTEQSDHLTLYATANDRALILSKWINEYPRAGSGGYQKIIVDPRLESVDVESRFFSKNHSYVFDTDKVQNDLSILIKKNSNAAERGLEQRMKSPHHYWEFR